MTNYDPENHWRRESVGQCIFERRQLMSEMCDNPKKINVFIEARSTLGNNAPAVLSQQRKLDDD